MKQKPVSKKPSPRLSEAEWVVMKPLWEQGALAARDIYDALPDNHGWAYKTVKTMLSRLVKKGVVKFTPIGNSYLYEPAYSRAEMVRSEVRGFKDRVLDGALQPFLVSFFEGEKPSKEDLSILREMLQKYDSPGSRGRKARGDGHDGSSR